MEIGIRSNLHKELYRKLLSLVHAELVFRTDALRATVGEPPGNAKAVELEFRAQMAKEEAKTNFEAIIDENADRSNKKLAKERGKARNRKLKVVAGGVMGGTGALASMAMNPTQAYAALEKCRDEFQLSNSDIVHLMNADALTNESIPGVFSKDCNLKMQTSAIAKALDGKAQITDGHCNMIKKDMSQLKKLQDGDVNIDFPTDRTCGATNVLVNGQNTGTFHRLSEDNVEFESIPAENLSVRISAVKNPELDFVPESVTCMKGSQLDGQCTTDIKQKITGPQGNASRTHMLDERLTCESAKSYTSMRPLCEVAKNRDALKQALNVYSLKCMGGFKAPGDAQPAEATN